MTDPVFNRASPIPIGGKAFAMVHTPKIDDMPKIDAVIISHDHYDHLDHRVIQELNEKVTHFYVPLVSFYINVLNWQNVKSTSYIKSN